MTRNVTTRRPPHAVAATAAAATGGRGIPAIAAGVSGDGESAPLCVRPALGA